jgi:hypothetical protein
VNSEPAGYQRPVGVSAKQELVRAGDFVALLGALLAAAAGVYLTAAHTEGRADGVTRTGAREALRAGRPVLDLLGLAQGIHRFIDGQEDCRFERAKRTAATNRQRNRGHGHVVGGLP